MTVILPFGRVLTRQVLPRSNHLLSRFASTNPLLRASCRESGETDGLNSKGSSRHIRIGVSFYRGYATEASSKPAGRPKAHTGRTTARKTSATTKSTATKKRPATKAKARAKTKAKPKAKVKAKPKPRKKVKGPPSKSAIYKAQVAKSKALKEKALLDVPKELPGSSWILYCSQERKKRGTGLSLAESAQQIKDIAQDYKSISPEEQEQLNHTANQNKAKNEVEFKKWLSQFTPLQIKEANTARRALNKQAKAKGSKRAPIRMLKDERAVKRPKTAYSLFTADRHASKDFKRMAIAEASRLISREWKALSPSEKKTYEDQAQADSNRYHEEYRTVYGTELRSVRQKKASST